MIAQRIKRAFRLRFGIRTVFVFTALAAIGFGIFERIKTDYHSEQQALLDIKRDIYVPAISYTEKPR